MAASFFPAIDILMPDRAIIRTITRTAMNKKYFTSALRMSKKLSIQDFTVHL